MLKVNLTALKIIIEKILLYNKKLPLMFSLIVLFNHSVLASDNANYIVPKEVYTHIEVNNIESDWLDSPIYTINEKTYFPLRTVITWLGMSINWDENEAKIVIKTESNKLFSYMDKESYRSGYKDINGEIIIEPIYAYTHDFSEGLGWVRPMPGYFSTYIDKNGEQVLPEYTAASSFNEGVAYVSVATNPQFFQTDVDIPIHFIDSEGNVVIDKEFTNGFCGSFHDGYARVLKSGYTYPVPYRDKPDIWTFIDRTGEYANDMEFEDVSDFNNGYAYVKNDGKWGVIDTDFNLVIDYQYSEYADVKRAFNTFEVYKAYFKFIVDGKEKKLSEDVIVLNDTTYLSAKDIGDLLNLDYSESEVSGYTLLQLSNR